MRLERCVSRHGPMLRRHAVCRVGWGSRARWRSFLHPPRPVMQRKFSWR
jgi:hypothetical protein